VRYLSDKKIESLFHEKIKDITNMFKEKSIVYGDDYFTEDSVFVERYYGGLARKFQRLSVFAKKSIRGECPDEGIETMDETLKDIAVYALMELVRKEYEKSK